MNHRFRVSKLSRRLGLAALAGVVMLAGAAHAAETKTEAAGKTGEAPAQAAPQVLKEVKKLDRPTSIGGYLCIGYLRRWDDGSLNQCKLAADTPIQGLTIPEDSTVWFYPGGTRIQHVWLRKELTVQGVACHGGMKIDTAFYPSGKLKETFLPRPATIQGIACKEGVMSPVIFFESGKLKQCTLAKEQEIGGKKVAAGLIVVLDEDGKVVEAKKPAGKLEILRQIFSRKERKGK